MLTGFFARRAAEARLSRREKACADLLAAWAASDFEGVDSACQILGVAVERAESLVSDLRELDALKATAAKVRAELAAVDGAKLVEAVKSAQVGLEAAKKRLDAAVLAVDSNSFQHQNLSRLEQAEPAAIRQRWPAIFRVQA